MENEGFEKMNNLFLHILTPYSLKSIKKCQRYGHLNACESSFKNDTKANWLDLAAIAAANTAHVSMTANFKSAVGRVTALALNLYSTFSKMSL